MYALRAQLRRIALRFGYDIRKVGGSRFRESIGQSCRKLASLGIRPKTVIDVGVAEGTYEVYEAFPDARLVLIEPLEEFRGALEKVLEARQGFYQIAAASREDGELSINVHPDHLHGSSLLNETMGEIADGLERVVPTITIDGLIARRGLDGPYLLKVDVQGAELDVLDGSAETLRTTEAVILEVSLFEFMIGAPQLADVVGYMKQRGFAAWDIVLGWDRPLDGALGQVDIVFVTDNGPLRRDHAYATSAQLEQLFGQS